MTMPGAAAPPSHPTPDTEAAAQRRMRRAMVFAFVALAALALFQAGYAHRYEKVRAVDADLVALAGQERAFAQELGRLAVVAGPADAAVPPLRQALDRFRSDALVFDAMLAEQGKLEGEPSEELREALLEARERRLHLWQATEDLLRADAGARDGAAAALQRRVEPAFEAASSLAEMLQDSARERSRGQLRLLEAGVALTFVLLLLLAVFVVVPMARAVRSQMRRLGEQAAELERLALVAAHTDNVVIVTGGDRRIQWVNGAFVRRTGWRAEQAVGRLPGPLLLHGAGNDGEALRRVRGALLRGGGQRAELALRMRDGSAAWFDVDLQPLAAEGGAPRGHVVVASDVTERRRLEGELQHSARTDALTGLPNRAVVLDRIQRAIEHAQRHPGYGFAVLFMDFDRFKQVNDTLGHAVGDALLRQAARRIDETLRPGDAVGRVASSLHVAARIGGDEFVVVLEGIRTVDDARTVAQRLLDVLGAPYLLGPHVVQSGASIGIVGSEHAAGTADEVLRDADTAMYEAKRAGRGRCVVFDSSMHERVVQALEVENDLRRALRDNELFVVYQPVLDLASGRMVAVEALVRWRHPTQGIVPPVRFIGVAEECGLIDAIGQQVLQGACRQLAAWRTELGEHAPGYVAVNLSRAQLQLPDLVADVRQVLEANGLAPQDLELEITESLAAQDEHVQATLRALKALGVRLALDDFGTGYSSLSCLHQLPVDTVKIDRSFVMHAETVEYHRVLIEATIRVAQALGMTTVAEGIETAGQAALMEGMHCDRGQGWLYAKALPADELASWALARQQAAVVSD